MVEFVRKTEDNAVDIVNAILGALLFVTPWFFGFAGESRPAWNAWIFGAVIVLLALAALIQFQEWEEWLTGLAGLWTLIAPWALGFAANQAALWSHVVVGVIVAVLAAYEAWRTHHPSPHVTA